MFKLDLEKAEEPEINLPTYLSIKEKQENSRKNIYFCFIEYTKALTVWITGKWKTLKENTRLPYLPPEKSVCRSKATI